MSEENFEEIDIVDDQLAADLFGPASDLASSDQFDADLDPGPSPVEAAPNQAPEAAEAFPPMPPLAGEEVSPRPAQAPDQADSVDSDSLAVPAPLDSPPPAQAQAQAAAESAANKSIFTRVGAARRQQLAPEFPARAAIDFDPNKIELVAEFAESSGLDMHKPQRSDPDPFLARLEPVGQSELLRLQAETSHDELIYVRAARHHRQYFWRYHLAAIIASLLTISAFASIGEYWTSILLNPLIPTVLVDYLPIEIIEIGFFVLGSLLPIGLFWILLNGSKAFLGIISRVSLLEVFFFGIALFFAIWLIVLAGDGAILEAWLAVIIYAFFNEIVKYLTRPFGGGRG